MSEVNFYLKPPLEKNGPRLIYLQLKYRGQKFFYSFGEKVTEANWNTGKQRVKNNKSTTSDGKHSLNELLDSLEVACLKAYNQGLADGAPQKILLKKALNDFINQNLEKPKSEKPTLFKLIDRFIAGEIQFRGKDKSAGSLNNYRSVKIHLEEFQKKNGYRLDFDTITLDFFYSYVSFLKKLVPKNSRKDQKTKGLSTNTIAKDITLIKVFMGEAVDLGLTNNLQFRHKKFTVAGQETDAVALDEKEIMKLYRHDYSNNKKIEQVRDLFVVGCLTGLRHSDYSNILPENIVPIEGELCIKMKTQKTGELVIIPVNPIVLEIFDKYKSNSNRLPRSISNQKFNDYIKKACETAGLVEPGRLSTDAKLKLWQCVSSHTARRSFATNLNRQGFPTIELMKITGHTTEKSFMKYIKVSKLDAAKRLSEHVKKNWSRFLLSVAS